MKLTKINLAQQCIIEAINQTEYIGRGITKNIAEDFSGRIKYKTGLEISGKTIYSIFRNRLHENQLQDVEKDAIAQFAHYHNWEHYILNSKSSPNNKKKFPIKLFLYVATFMLGIYLAIMFFHFLFL